MLEQILNEFHKFLSKPPDNGTLTTPQMGRFVYPVPEETIVIGSKNLFLLPDSQFFWKQPKENLFFHSIGRIDPKKVYDFNQLLFSKRTFNNLRLEITTNKDSDVLKRIPYFLGNSEFAPFSMNSIWIHFFNVNWFIPKVLLLLDNNTPLLVYNFSLKNEKKIIFDEFSLFCKQIFSPEPAKTFKPGINKRKDLPFEDWQNLVNKALGEIKNKKFDKVVLSRKTEFNIEGKPGISLFSEVAERYKECVTFFNKEDDSLFFGITPERLLKVSGNKINTESLAGSIKRSGNDKEDLLLSEQLLNSGKNLMEQKYVTDYILSRLTPFTKELSFSKAPELIKLENIQHLKTNFEGVLKEDKFFFDLLNELQPTPAVCGYPKEEAYKFIIENEGYERGLYSGFTGWFNLNSEGEFAVSIRSALIKGEKLFAFSGCGIVDGSDARSEYEETELKLKPILSIFEHGN